MRVSVLGGIATGPAIAVGCSGYLVNHGATSVVLDPITIPSEAILANSGPIQLAAPGVTVER